MTLEVKNVMKLLGLYSNSIEECAAYDVEYFNSDARQSRVIVLH